MNDGETVSTLDETLKRALFAVAGELQITMASLLASASATGQVGVRESDLQRALCRALQAQLGSVASIEGPLPPPVKEHWSGRLGRADVVAHLGSTDVYLETKLCADDKLYEAVWDLLKLALLTACPSLPSGTWSTQRPRRAGSRRPIARPQSSRMDAPESSSCFATAALTPGDGVSTAPRPRGQRAYLHAWRPCGWEARPSALRAAPGRCAASVYKAMPETDGSALAATGGRLPIYDYLTMLEPACFGSAGGAYRTTESIVKMSSVRALTRITPPRTQDDFS